MPSTVYAPEDLPAGTSWVFTLNAQDATSQCHVLGISPSPTLSENRTLLSEFLKTLQLNGGPEPLPSNFRPDLTHAGPTPQVETDGKQSRGSTTTQAPSVTTTTATVSQAPLAPSTAGNKHDNASTILSNDIAILKTDGGRPLTVEWTQLVQDTAIAVGQQVASAMAGSRSPPRAIQGKMKVLDDLVGALPVTTGSQPSKLTDFLISVAGITKLGLFIDEDILLAVLPRTAEQLRTFWLKGIADRASLEHVVGGVRDFFLPAQIRHTMVTTMVYRVQQPSESLSEFVDSISAASSLLIPGFTERDVLDTVLNGLNAPTRAALAAFPAACSLSDLLALVPRVQVVRTLEQGQAVSRSDTTQRGVEHQHNQHSRFRPTNNLSQLGNNNRFAGRDTRNFSNFSGQAFAPRIPQFPFAQNHQHVPRPYHPPQQSFPGRSFNSPRQEQGNTRGGHR